MDIKVFGRDVLGEKGFCQNVKLFPTEKEYSEILVKIRNQISKDLDLRSISMTSLKDIEMLNKLGGYQPQIVHYYKDMDPVFDPEVIFDYCLAGQDEGRPSADFVVFDPEDKIVVLAYSNVAPIIVAINPKNGKRAIGTILRSSLEKYCGYLLDSLFNELDGNYYLDIVLSTNHEYDDWKNGKTMSIPKFIECEAKEREFIINVTYAKDPNDENNDLFTYQEGHNNVVVLR